MEKMKAIEYLRLFKFRWKPNWLASIIYVIYVVSRRLYCHLYSEPWTSKNNGHSVRIITRNAIILLNIDLLINLHDT